MTDENASCSTFNKTQSSSNFGDLVKMKAFVDKTAMIKKMFGESSILLITAPRGFGKSTNMEMIKAFIEIQVDDNGAIIEKKDSSNYRIFKDNKLLIFQDKDFFDEHFATYPVIHTNFKHVRAAKSFDEVLEGFRTVLNKTYLEHKYLLKSKIWSEGYLSINIFNKYYITEKSKTLGKRDIIDGLDYLSNCLSDHFDNKKVFVLIDEYDAPINNAMFEKAIEIDNVNELLDAIFLNTLKENECVRRALLTGVFNFARLFFGANNVEKYMFLDKPFVMYYGLMESEVDVLLSKFEIDGKEAKDVKVYYYNGYNSKQNVKLFSLSVLHYLQTKELISYWETSGIIYGLKEGLRVPVIQFAIEKLLQDKYAGNIRIIERISPHDMVELRAITLSTDKTWDPDLFLNFLLHQGYLAYKSTDENGKYAVVTIPNEIHNEFTKQLYMFYGNCSNRVLEECTVAFGQISVSDTSSFQKFVEKFQLVVDAISADIIKENEYIFHSLLLSVICRGQFKVYDVKYLGSTHRPDLIVTTGKNGFIIVIKFRGDSKKALKQIIQNKYYTEFDREKFKDMENKLYLAVNVSEDLFVSLAVLVNTLDINKAEYFPQ